MSQKKFVSIGAFLVFIQAFSHNEYAASKIVAERMARNPNPSPLFVIRDINHDHLSV